MGLFEGLKIHGMILTSLLAVEKCIEGKIGGSYRAWRHPVRLFQSPYKSNKADTVNAN